MSDILELIKRRTTIRKYKKKKVPKKILDKIIEAGIWGPSIHHMQPWKFVLINNENHIETIKGLLVKSAKKISLPGFILFPSLVSLSTPQCLICVYNTKAFSNLAKKLGERLFKNAQVAELSAIAASVQNMVLVMENLKVGCCWLDSLLFCQKEINTLLNVEEDLVAVLSVGFPDEKGNRSARKSLKESIKYFNG